MSLTHHVQTGSGTRPVPPQRVLKALSPGAERTGCQTDHSSPLSAEIKNEWKYISTPPIFRHDLYKKKNFTFARLQASAAVELNSLVYWVITRR